METKGWAKERHTHSNYTDKEIDALLEYFQSSGLELRKFLDSSD